MERNDGYQSLRSEGDLNLSPHRAAWLADQLDAATRAWLEQDAACFLHQSLSTPCLDVLRAGAGSRIEDLSGRTFLDFHGNNVHQVGFSHTHVINAIKHQLDQLAFCPRRFTNIPAIQLAQKLIELTQGKLQRVLFAPGGTSAIGMALKLARAATGRYKTISLWDSFHGASLDAISVGGEAIFRSGIGPLLPGCEHAPPPDPRHCPFQCGAQCNLACADYIEYMLEKEGDVAAVLAETVRSHGVIPPPDYWPRIRAACDRHGALLILDEIPICLGRTGRMFAYEHYGVVPDMLVLGKGLGGGVFPLAALVTAERFNRVMPERALGHYTHEKSPVACAAALAAIEVIEQEKLVERAQESGRYLLERLNQLKLKYPLLADVRGLGLLLGIELVTREGKATDEAERVMYAALARGLSFKVTMGNILTLTPALTISIAELDEATAILDASLRSLETMGP